MSYCECGNLTAPRAGARYCSSACRQRAYRDRKRLFAGRDPHEVILDALAYFNRLTSGPSVTDKAVTRDDRS